MTGLVATAAALSPDLPRWTRGIAAVAALPLLAGVLDAGSRGGLMGLGAGVSLLGLLLVAGGRRRGGLALIAAAALGLVVAFVVLPERLIGESLPETVTVGEIGSNFERSRIYLAEGAMVRSAPLVGIGVGAFRTAYPAFQDGATTLAPIHGESDWLETLAEGGLPLLLAWIVLVGALVAPVLRVVRRGRAPVLLMGLVAALGGVLVHASVDFHLREPSVVLVAIVIAATGHSWARRLESEQGDAREPAVRSPRWTRPAVVTLAILGAAGCIALAHVVPWDAAMRAAELAFAKGEIESARTAVLRATKAAPERGASWALLAASEEQLARVADAKTRERHRAAALDAAVEALRRDPSALGAARIAAQALLAAGALPEALQAGRLAVLVAPGQAAAHRALGEALMLDGRGDEALPHLAFALDAMPGAQLAAQAPLLTRLIRDVGGQDPARIFGALKTRRARIAYVHDLQRAHHEDEIGPYLRFILAEGVPAEEADDWSYGLVGNSPEAVELARALLKDARSPIALTRIGRTLAQAGDPKGRALLEQVVARDDAPALVFEVLVTLLKQEGRLEEARAMAQRGLERHPEQPGFEAMVRSLAPK
jgi:tetratricopeptide (TPR) repeat protein